MKFASFKYQASGNLGDEIQTLAAEQHLPQVDVRVNRDSMRSVRLDSPHLLIMNGWFSRYPHRCFPPSDSILPLFFGFHLSNWKPDTYPHFLENPECLETFRAHQPIGCRDQHTMELLQERGIEAWYSKCLTLTFPSRTNTPDPTRAKVFLVNVEAQLPGHLAHKRVLVTHGTQDYFGDDLKRRMARHLLDMYRDQAELVITNKLHCALPCLAMGIPLIFVGNPGNYRTSILRDLGVAFHTSDQLANDPDSVNWAPGVLDISGEKQLAVKRITAMVQQRSR